MNRMIANAGCRLNLACDSDMNKNGRKCISLEKGTFVQMDEPKNKTSFYSLFKVS